MTGLSRSIINTSGRVWSESMPHTNPRSWRLTQNWQCVMLWISCDAMRLPPIWTVATPNRWLSFSVITLQTTWTTGNHLWNNQRMKEAMEIFKHFYAQSASMAQMDHGWNLDIGELAYSPSARDLSDAKVHHMLSEELWKPYRRVSLNSRGLNRMCRMYHLENASSFRVPADLAIPVTPSMITTCHRLITSITICTCISGGWSVKLCANSIPNVLNATGYER